jgi:hypothetical protein
MVFLRWGGAVACGHTRTQKIPHCCVASSHAVTLNSRCQTEFICHGDKSRARRRRYFIVSLICILRFPKTFPFFYFLLPKNPVSFFIINVYSEGTAGGEKGDCISPLASPINKIYFPYFRQIWQSTGNSAWYKIWKILLPFIYRLIPLFMHSFMYRLSIYLSLIHLSNYSSTSRLSILSLTRLYQHLSLAVSLGCFPAIAIYIQLSRCRPWRRRGGNRVTPPLVLKFGTWWLVT